MVGEHAATTPDRPSPLRRGPGWSAAPRRALSFVRGSPFSSHADVSVLRRGERDRDFGRTRGLPQALHGGVEPAAGVPRSGAVRLRCRRARRWTARDHATDRIRSVTPAAGPRRAARHRAALRRRRRHARPVVRLRARSDAHPDAMRPVYVTGVGLHPFGRFADRSLTALGVVAVRDALADANVTRGGFQAAFCGTVYGGVATGHKVLTALGLSGVPIVNVEAGCASGGAALSLAAAQVASGQHDTVLAFGVEKMPRGMIRSSFFEPWREEAGLAATPAYFALRAQRLMLESDVRPADLAAVSVKNHRHAVPNPSAMYRQECASGAVLASPLVCDPLRLLMLCSPNEGAAAVVVSSTPRASSVRIAAAVLRSHLAGSVLGEHTPLGGVP